MPKTNINILIDNELKEQFKDLCSESGISMSTAFCLFAKTVVREQKIPFEITAENDPFYSTKNMERLRKSVAEIESTGGTIHEVELDD